MPNPAGIPKYDVPFLNEDGKTVSQVWYRFLRAGAEPGVQLIQGALADRPSATEFHDGTVLFIDTGTSFQYYVEGSVWVKVLT